MLYSLIFLAGAAVIAKQTLGLSRFLWFYLLRPSSVKKYLHGNAPYALVTGATDGIGKASARELFARGFNLIIHGRNEEKVKKVVEEFKALGSGDVRYFIADAAKSGHDFDQLLKPFAELNITVVLHNVGGVHMNGKRMDTFSDADLVGLIAWNDTFPLLLTRALLPQLRTTSQRGPVLMQFVGSQAAIVGPPTLAVYAATKAFLSTLVRGLDNDEHLWGVPSNVQFEYLSVGNVSSAGNPLTVTMLQPSAARFGKALVEKMGCGRRYYAPYMMHAIVERVCEMLPERMVDSFAAAASKNVYEERDKRI